MAQGGCALIGSGMGSLRAGKVSSQARASRPHAGAAKVKQALPVYLVSVALSHAWKTLAAVLGLQEPGDTGGAERVCCCNVFVCLFLHFLNHNVCSFPKFLEMQNRKNENHQLSRS